MTPGIDHAQYLNCKQDKLIIVCFMYEEIILIFYIINWTWICNKTVNFSDLGHSVFIEVSWAYTVW